MLVGLSWLLTIAFLGWAVRVAFLEGYWYELPKAFAGDFAAVASGRGEFWSGQGLFYGPIFVLEYRTLLAPGHVSIFDIARLDFVLFGTAFVCTWLALFGRHRPRLAIFVLAAWLAHYSSVAAFANAAHLEVLELAFISLALLLSVRGHAFSAGASLGLAAATKVLPAVFWIYLALMRRWRTLAGALVLAAATFLVVCWLQGLSVAEGLYALIYQDGNLTQLEFSEYHVSARAEFARIIAGEGGSLSAGQAQLAGGLHWLLALVSSAGAGWVMFKTQHLHMAYGLQFGLIAAVMLIASPSVHLAFLVFLLPAWTAILAELLRRPVSGPTLTLWVALAASFTFSGFDQPFFLANRVFGVGLTVPQHWMAWHLPGLALLLTIGTLAALLLTFRDERTKIEDRLATTPAFG